MISSDRDFHSVYACLGLARFSSHFYFILVFSVKMQLYLGADSIPEHETLNGRVSYLASRVWVIMESRL